MANDLVNLTPFVVTVNGKHGPIVNLTAADLGVGGAGVISINGLSGAVTLASGDVPESSNLYYTDSRVQAFSDLRYARLASSNIFTQNQRLAATGVATPGVPKNSYSLILSGASDTGLGSTNRSTIITNNLTGGAPGLVFDVVDTFGVVKTFRMQSDGVFYAPNGSVPSAHSHIAADISDLNSKLTYTHDQGTVSAIWTITHNLGRVPTVTCYEFIGGIYQEIVGHIEYDPADINVLTVRFNAAMAGRAILT